MLWGPSGKRILAPPHMPATCQGACHAHGPLLHVPDETKPDIKPDQLNQSLNSAWLAACRTEGMVGLYRGFGLSIVTFVPSSAMWWGAYGGYQKLVRTRNKKTYAKSSL